MSQATSQTSPLVSHRKGKHSGFLRTLPGEWKPSERGKAVLATLAEEIVATRWTTDVPKNLEPDLVRAETDANENWERAKRVIARQPIRSLEDLVDNAIVACDGDFHLLSDAQERCLLRIFRWIFDNAGVKIDEANWVGHPAHRDRGLEKKIAAYHQERLPAWEAAKSEEERQRNTPEGRLKSLRWDIKYQVERIAKAEQDLAKDKAGLKHTRQQLAALEKSTKAKR